MGACNEPERQRGNLTMTKDDELPGTMRPPIQYAARETFQEAARETFQEAAREAFQEAARETMQDASLLQVIQQAAREAIQTTAQAAIQEAAREAFEQSQLHGSRIQGNRSHIQLSVIHAEHRHISSTLLDQTIIHQAAQAESPPTFVRSLSNEWDQEPRQAVAPHSCPMCFNPFSVAPIPETPANNQPEEPIQWGNRQSGVPVYHQISASRILGEPADSEECRESKYPWDRLTQSEHDSLVNMVELTHPEEEPCSKQHRGQKCLDLLHAGHDGDYKLFFTGCYHSNPSQALVGLDFDDEEIIVADQVGSWRCMDAPRYAFLYREYRFLQQGNDRNGTFFKIWRGQTCVYDASTQGRRRFGRANTMIGRPKCSGWWFYMIIKDADPRLVRVSLDKFEEEVVIPEATDISDFVVDEAQTITYVTKQMELRQLNNTNIMVTSTCLDLGESVSTIFRVAGDLFVTVNPGAKILVLSDTKTKFDRFVAWMVGTSSHNSDQVAEVLPIYTQQVMFLLVCGARGQELGLTVVYKSTIRLITRVTPL